MPRTAIAAHALAEGAILFTANVDHMTPVADLKVGDSARVDE